MIVTQNLWFRDTFLNYYFLINEEILGNLIKSLLMNGLKNKAAVSRIYIYKAR